MNTGTSLFHRYLFLCDYIIVLVDPCADHECPRGSTCKVYEPTNEAYCDPSCELDNGGCEFSQTCELETVQCVRAPCPLVVVCKDARKILIYFLNFYYYYYYYYTRARQDKGKKEKEHTHKKKQGSKKITIRQDQNKIHKQLIS